MKLDWIWIKEFKNLKDIEIDFDEKSSISVLIGWNGSGKSNLIEAIVLIFRNLDLKDTLPFAYKIKYICNNHKIEIDASQKQIYITIDGSQISYTKFVSAENRKYLPSYVFGYYSGPSNRLETHFEKHQNKFYTELINQKNDEKALPLRPLFYAREAHSHFVLLSFFMEDNVEIKKFLRDYLNIEGLESILFIMREPDWKSNDGDTRFWKARGVVRQFLSELYSISLAPLRETRQIPIAFRKKQSKEFLYLFVKDIESFKKLTKQYSNHSDFFKALESTYISQILDEVRIRVKIRGSDNALTFKELSEGEQQLLTVMGLLRFTKQEETLFLLDEPDTHLNPAWSMEYLYLLKKYCGDFTNSHLIINTHDPLLISELSKEQVQIMNRDSNTGKIIAVVPDINPRGLGYAGILTELFNLSSTLDKSTMDLLNEKRKLAVKEELTADERKKLAELNERLQNLDFTNFARDPLYKEFVEAVSKTREFMSGDIKLTEAQKKERKEKALEIMKELTGCNVVKFPNNNSKIIEPDSRSKKRKRNAAH